MIETIADRLRWFVNTGSDMESAFVSKDLLDLAAVELDRLRSERDEATSALPQAVRNERERWTTLRAMAQQVVDADDKQELTQQLIDLLRESLQVFK
jgi:hypothetical protein